MARNKTLLMKEIKGGLEQALHILNSLDTNPTFQEITAAANSANQATMQLHRLAGMIDVESDLPRR
jgi:hypothetical protein